MEPPQTQPQNKVGKQEPVATSLRSQEPSTRSQRSMPTWTFKRGSFLGLSYSLVGRSLQRPKRSYDGRSRYHRCPSSKTWLLRAWPAEAAVCGDIPPDPRPRPPHARRRRPLRGFLRFSSLPLSLSASLPPSLSLSFCLSLRIYLSFHLSIYLI